MRANYDWSTTTPRYPVPAVLDHRMTVNHSVYRPWPLAIALGAIGVLGIGKDVTASNDKPSAVLADKLLGLEGQLEIPFDRRIRCRVGRAQEHAHVT